MCLQTYIHTYLYKYPLSLTLSKCVVNVVAVLCASAMLSAEYVMSHMLVKSCVDHMGIVIVQEGGFTILILFLTPLHVCVLALNT